jgi:hypothetical protein
MGRLVAVLAVFLIIGAPIAYYVWDTLSDLLAGNFEGTAVVSSLVLLVVFIVVSRFLGKYVRSISS